MCRHGRQASSLAQRAEKSPSLLIKKNHVLMRFGIRHSVALRHSCALGSYSCLLGCGCRLPLHVLLLP